MVVRPGPRRRTPKFTRSPDSSIDSSVGSGWDVGDERLGQPGSDQTPEAELLRQDETSGKDLDRGKEELPRRSRS